MDHPPLAVQHMGTRVRRIPGRRSGRRLGRTPAVPRAVRRGRRRKARRGRSPGQHRDDHCGVYGQARGRGDPVTARLLHRGCRSVVGVRCGHRVTELEQSQADRQSHPPNTDDHHLALAPRHGSMMTSQAAGRSVLSEGQSAAVPSLRRALNIMFGARTQRRPGNLTASGPTGTLNLLTSAAQSKTSRMTRSPLQRPRIRRHRRVNRPMTKGKTRCGF
jgi:hypothetical protein